MDCQRYENWLTDAALEALNPAYKRELDLHLAECAACRARLARERNLVASIDASLAQSLDAQLPGGFATRMRVRLAEEAATRRSWIAEWIPLAAGALAVAVFAIVGWMSWRAVPVRRQGSRSQESEVRSQRAEGGRHKAEVRMQKAESRRNSPGTGIQEPAQRGSLRPPWARTRSGRRRGDAEPQVLVDKSQWPAILTLYNDTRNGRVDGGSLVAKQHEDADALMKPIEIKPLEVPPLSADLKPLDSGGAQ